MYSWSNCIYSNTFINDYAIDNNDLQTLNIVFSQKCWYDHHLDSLKEYKDLSWTYKITIKYAGTIFAAVLHQCAQA